MQSYKLQSYNGATKGYNFSSVYEMQLKISLTILFDRQKNGNAIRFLPWTSFFLMSHHSTMVQRKFLDSTILFTNEGSSLQLRFDNGWKISSQLILEPQLLPKNECVLMSWTGYKKWNKNFYNKQQVKKIKWGFYRKLKFSMALQFNKFFLSRDFLKAYQTYLVSKFNKIDSS